MGMSSLLGLMPLLFPINTSMGRNKAITAVLFVNAESNAMKGSRMNSTLQA